MKTNFKFFALAALALALGFSSCSKDDGDSVPQGQKKVVVKIDLNGASSRAEGSTTADGVSPNLTDLKLFFVGGGFVQKVADVSSPVSGTATSFVVPNATSKVYAIGNTGAGAVNSPTVLPTAGAPESAVQALLMEADKQGADAKNVNLSGGQGAGGTAYAGASFNTSDEAEFNIMPAIARYEIKKVSSSATAVAGVEQPLTGFKLTGIYITNTYRTLGLDYSTLPAATVDIINAGPGTPGFSAAIPTYLKDAGLNASASSALSFTPEGGGSFWHYYMMPPIAGKGTILGNNTENESSVPVIVLEISNAVTAVANGPTYASPSYVNVRKLVRTDNSQELTYLEPGKVYLIDDILFGGEHLTEEPGDNHQKSVTVKVTVLDWIGVGVKPEL